MEQSACKILNVHHFGGINQLPNTAKYVGRPSAFGNAYSSHTGKYTREECIALHRIAVYHNLIHDPTYLALLKKELGGYDLACWCVHPDKVKGCHAETYLHVLSEVCKDRTYDRSVIFYLMDDLKRIVPIVKQWVTDIASPEQSLMAYICVSETHVNLEYALKWCREKDVATQAIEFFLAHAVINLELARQDRNLVMVEYRLLHTSWLCNRLLQGRTDRDMEPSPPSIPLKRKSSQKD